MLLPYRLLAAFLFSLNERRRNSGQKYKSIKSFVKKSIRRISPSCSEAGTTIHLVHSVHHAEARGNVKMHIHFLHHSPGRVRIQIDELKGNAQLGKAIYSFINKVQGVTQITANTITGSVLICYDKADPHVLPYLKSMMNAAETLLDMHVTDPVAFAMLLDAYAREQ